MNVGAAKLDNKMWKDCIMYYLMNIIDFHYRMIFVVLKCLGKMTMGESVCKPRRLSYSKKGL